MHILKVFHPTNEYLYIPDDHDCEDNTNIWIQTTKEVDSKHISIKDIWETMIDKCISAKKTCLRMWDLKFQLKKLVPVITLLMN